MPITFEQFHIFRDAEMEQAREIAKTFSPEINLPIAIGSFFGRSALMELCSDKEITYKEEKLNLLLDLGADPNVVEKYYGSPLMQALKYDMGAEFIKILLDTKADINLPDDSGKTSVFVAVEHRRFDNLCTLLSRGGNLNHKAKNGNTTLTDEIEREKPSLDVVKLLIELGADVNAARNLHATFYGDEEQQALHIVETLIKSGANVNVSDDQGISPLALAASTTKCPMSTIAMLVNAGAVIDSVDAKGMTPLLHASESGNTEAVKFLLECKASLTHCDAEGKSALHWCCKGGNAAIVPLLVNAGAELNIQDKADSSRGGNNGGRTPLMYAVRRGDTTKALLKFGPDVNVVDKKEQSALMLTLAGFSDKKADIVEMLLKKKAKVELADLEGNTALHLIVKEYGSAEAVVKLLLDAKADPNAVNDFGETPLMLCRESKSMELLIKGGANVDAIDKAGKTALIHGVNGYGSDAHLKIKVLLNAKANPDIGDNEGKTVLMYAVRSDTDVKSVRLLVDHGANLELLDKKDQPATAHASPDNLMLLITAGAKPSSFEGSRLAIAVHDDNLPLATILLERGATMKLKLEHVVRLKKIFEKLARSNSDLLRTGVACTDPEAQEQFDTLLAKFAKNKDIASEGDLPEILKNGAWPIKQAKRTQIVLAAPRLVEISRVIDYFYGTVDWPEDLKKSLLNRFNHYSADKKAKKSTVTHATAQDYFKNLLLRKERRIKFELFFENWSPESEQNFVKFWNENGAILDERVVTGGWRSLDSDHIAYLLARFDIAVLPGIIQAEKKSSKFAEALGYVDAPGCAPLMARWMGSGPASRLARQWALKYPESCVKGLIVDAVSKVGKDRSAAEAVFRFIASRGHKQTVQSIALQFGEDVLESISETLSQDFRTDFMPSKPAAMPKFWSADVYPTPRLKANNKALPPYAVDAVASMMSMSNSEVRSPALDEVIKACDPKTLASFAWGAFEEWAAKGKKDSEWIFDALTYFGDDTCARKLTPYIRNWPRENGIARARKGLEILAAIGTDVALSQIQAISQKNKYQSILDSAQEMMKVIATARELTPQQLEDRLVPDLGLSDRGEIKLDFGSRHFTGSIDAQLKPVVKDASGAVLKALPSAGRDDDENLAKEAAAEWVALCKDLKPIAKLQLERLELAMVNSRRWTGSDFKTLFVVSPLLQNLVKGLVWGIFSSKSKLSATFVVSAENAFVDADGKLVKISDGSSIGIAHPLLLDEESLAAWQKLFAKNKQVQPFAQLVRKVYRAKDDIEGNRFGLNGATVASKALKGLLALGWHTDIGDAGWIWSFERSFSSGRASLSADPGVHITDYEYNSKEQKLEVSIPDTLNPMEFSEIIRELMTLKK